MKRSIVLFNFLISFVACDFTKDRQGRGGEYYWSDYTTQQVDSLVGQLADKANRYWHHDFDSARMISDTLHLMNEFFDNPSLRRQIYIEQGISNYTYGDYDKAIRYYDSAIWLSNKSGLDALKVVENKMSLLKKVGNFNALKEISDSLIVYPDSLLKDYVNLYFSLIDFYIKYNQLSQAENYLNIYEEKKLADASALEKANYFLIAARLYREINNYDTSHAFVTASIRYFKEQNDRIQLAFALLERGEVYYEQTKYAYALSDYNEAYEIFKNEQYNFGIALCNMRLGILMSSVSEYSEALNYLFEALVVFNTQKNYLEVATIYNDLAWIYIHQSFFNKAEEYLKASINLSQNIKNNVSLGSAYNIMGILYEKKGDMNQALFHYTTALDIWREINFVQGIISASSNQSTILYQLGQKEAALQIQLEAYERQKEIGNALRLAVREISLAELCLDNGEMAKAKKLLESSRKVLTALGVQSELLKNYELTAEYYRRIGHLDQSNKYLRSYMELNKQVYNAENFNKIAELEAIFKLQEKENQIALLKVSEENRMNELALKEAVIENQRLFLQFVIVVLLLSLAFLFMTVRLLRLRSRANRALKRLNSEVNKQKEELYFQSEKLKEASEEIGALNEHLEAEVSKRTHELSEAYKELDTFFYKASHDFRGPIATFMGLAEVAKNGVQDQLAKELFAKVEATAAKLEAMVSKLNAISLITTVHYKKESFYCDHLLLKVLEQFESVVAERGIDLITHCNAPILISSYRPLLELVFENLIENAINFAKSIGGKVEIHSEKVGEQIRISISDNGDGIDKEMQDKVFELYYRAHQNSKGNGLGLYIVKKAIKVIGGRIVVESNRSHGTVMTVFIPISESLYG